MVNLLNNLPEKQFELTVLKVMKSFLKLADAVEILEVWGAGVAGREILILELEPVLGLELLLEELLFAPEPEVVAIGSGAVGVSSKAAML